MKNFKKRRPRLQGGFIFKNPIRVSDFNVFSGSNSSIVMDGVVIGSVCRLSKYRYFSRYNGINIRRYERVYSSDSGSELGKYIRGEERSVGFFKYIIGEGILGKEVALV